MDELGRLAPTARLVEVRKPAHEQLAAARALRNLDAGHCVASVTVGPARAGAQCIDEAIRDELNARRQYRGVQERLFQKARRHEFSVLGGAYAADLMSSSYLVGGAYTFHFSEDLGSRRRSVTRSRNPRW